MFLKLKKQNFTKHLDEIIIKKAGKVYHSKSHQDFRGSIYRGVSINGRCWQVLIMIDKEKIYLCSTHDIEKAARLYDLALI